MTKRIVLQGLELWGDVHYTVHRALAQSHPQQPWSRSPEPLIALEMQGAGGDVGEWAQLPLTPGWAYHSPLHRALDNKGLKNRYARAAKGNRLAVDCPGGFETSSRGLSKQVVVNVFMILALISSHRMKTLILQWELCPCHMKLVRDVKHFSEAGFSLEAQARAVWSKLAMGLS